MWWCNNAVRPIWCSSKSMIAYEILIKHTNIVNSALGLQTLTSPAQLGFRISTGTLYTYTANEYNRFPCILFVWYYQPECLSLVNELIMWFNACWIWNEIAQQCQLWLEFPNVEYLLFLRICLFNKFMFYLITCLIKHCGAHIYIHENNLKISGEYSLK